jgi:mannosyltransferase
LKARTTEGTSYLKATRESQEARVNTIFFRVSLSCILVVAGYLRFWTLGQQSLWLDEAISWLQLQHSLPELIKVTAADNTPPLHNLILFVLTWACGDSEVILRFPSAVFGVANVAAIYWLGLILNNRLAGLLAAFLLALSEFHIWYSQEARAYTLLALSATLFAVASVRYLQRPTLVYAFWAALTGVALLYSHAYGTLTWFSISTAVLVIILLAPAGILATASNWLLILMLTVGAFLPWALLVLWRPFGGWVALEPVKGRWIPDPNLHWIAEPTWRFVMDQFGQLASGPQPLVLLCVGVLAALTRENSESMTTNESLFELLCRTALLFVWLVSPPVLGLGVSLLLLFSLVLTRKLRPKRNTAPSATAPKHRPGLQLNYRIGLLLTWLLGPPLLGLVASVTLQPLLISRYLLGSLPAWLLLGSIGITRLAGRTGVVVVAFLMASLATFGLLIGPGKRADWRAVAASFAQQKHVGDCVVIYRSYMAKPFEYYYREQIPCLDLPNDPSSIDRSTPLANRVWIILADAPRSDGNTLIDTLLAVPRNHHQELAFTSVMETKGFGDVKVFILSWK